MQLFESKGLVFQAFSLSLSCFLRTLPEASFAFKYYLHQCGPPCVDSSQVWKTDLWLLRVGIKHVTTSDGWVQFTSADDSEVLLAFRKSISPLSNSSSIDYYENYNYNGYSHSRLLSNVRYYEHAICLSFRTTTIECSHTLKLSHTICSFNLIAN